jgi:Asp-tRNA(Asn)/Glu-tRNA(Gln) amidotransferase A subunit family amidase
VTASGSIWLARPEAPPSSERAVAVKDLLDTAGLVTTYGSIIFAEHVPAKNAAAVDRLEEAGYGVAGKTNLHEFAYGISSQNEHYGTVPNPRFPGRLAGGSSGGSAAAIASGEVDLALGSDSGGSIRIPAAWCGIVGFKPTFDLVDATGCFPLAPSYDHVGPMASTVDGCVELMCALVPGFAVPELDSLEELRIGYTWLDEADEAVRDVVATVVDLLPDCNAAELPLPDPAENALFMREVADVHRGLYPERADEYGEGIRWKLERCLAVTDAEVAAAERLRAEYRERCDEAFGELDLLVAPAVAIEPPAADADERELRSRGIRLTYPLDVLGWPALALPAGLTANGLPASIQLIGRPGDDARVLAVSRVLASLI